MGNRTWFLPWLVEHHQVLGGTCNQELHHKDLQHKDLINLRGHHQWHHSNRHTKEFQLQLEWVQHLDLHEDLWQAC